jgi:hypothetical protein
MRHVLFASGLALALAASATAQDPQPRPVVTGLRWNGKPVSAAALGGFVEAVGRDLHACPLAPQEEPDAKPPPCDHPGVVVRVAGQVVPIIGSTASGITFNLPADLGVGKKRVEVELDGRSAGTLELQLLPEGTPPPDGEDDDGQPAGPEPRDAFQVIRFDVLVDGAGTRFVVEGRADPITDGMAMAITLRFERRAVLESQLVRIDAGGYRATFGPYTRPLPLGLWEASALFELKSQPRVAVNRARLTPAQRNDLSRVERLDGRLLGTPEEIAAQRQALQAHYAAVAAETERLLDEVLLAYASASRVLFKNAGAPGYRVADHLAHVRDVRAARTPEEVARVQADLRFATAGGHLRPDAYQRWAEETLLPAWLGSFRRDGEFREATLVPVEPRSARLAEDLHTTVLGTLRTQSATLYSAAQVECPASLRDAPPGVVVPPLEATERGRRAFEAQRDELLRRAAGP